MLKIAKKQITRTGTSKVKVLFRVEVSKVTFPKTKELPVGSSVSICFERGGKVATSYERNVQETADGKLEIVFNETLSLVCTMYKNNESSFQEKRGKLIVRQRKRAKIGSDTYKGLGVLLLSLDGVADARAPLHIQSALQQGPIAGGIVDAIITPRFIGEPISHSDSRAENESVFSEASAEVADFDEEHDNHNEATPAKSHPQNSRDAAITTIAEDEEVPSYAAPAVPNTPHPDTSTSHIHAATDDHHEHIRELQERVQQLEAQVSHLSAEKEALEKSQQDFFVVVAMNNSLKQELESEREAHKHTLQQMKHEIAALREEHAVSQNEHCVSSHTDVEQLMQRNQELEEEVHRLRLALVEAEQTQNRSEQSDNDDVTRLQEQIVEWELQYKTDASTIASLKDEIHELSHQLASLKSSTADQNQAEEIRMLQERLKHADDVKNEDAEMINCLQLQLSEYAVKADTTEKIIHELQNRIKELSKAHDTPAALKSDEHTASKCHDNDKIELLEQRLSMVTLEKDSLLSMLSNVEAERDKLLETNEELGEKLSVELEAVKTYYEGNITTLENEKQQLEREILQLQNDIDVLNQRAVTAEDTADRESEMEALRDEIAKLKQQQAATVHHSPNRIEEKDATLNEQTAKIAELEENVARLRRKLNEQKETSAAEYASLAETLLLTENDFNIAQQELAALKEQVADIYAERNQLREEVRLLQTSNGGSDDHQSIVEELIAAKMQIAANAMEQDELQKKIQNYKRKVQTYAERIAAMEVEAAERSNVKEMKLNAKEKMKKMFRKGESK